MLIHQTIAKGQPERLVQGSLTTVADRDQWSVTVETSGFTDKGEPVTLRIVMSHNEVALLTRESAQ